MGSGELGRAVPSHPLCRKPRMDPIQCVLNHECRWVYEVIPGPFGDPRRRIDDALSQQEASTFCGQRRRIREHRREIENSAAGRENSAAGRSDWDRASELAVINRRRGDDPESQRKLVRAAINGL